MTRSTLPLRGIAVFEAVARLGSFKAAASELNLSRSAISHQIRALEAELGVELFKRVSRGVRLSADAAKYARTLNEAFDRIRAATATIAAPDWSDGASRVVRIMAPPSLVTQWLMPKLPAFIAAHPDIEPHVVAATSVEGNTEEFDITVRYGDASRWEGQAQPLLQEVVQPYCAPALLARRASLTARQLLSRPLIQSQDYSWQNWFSQRRIAFDTARIHPLKIDPSYVAIEAAVRGVGVILESSVLAHEHVAAGRLLAPVVESRTPETAYWLLPLHRGARRHTVKAHQWLIDQAADLA
jgi:LysR family glycine cleavage system transcriptional activator